MISKSCFYNTKNKLKHRLQKLMYQKSKKNVMRRTIYIIVLKFFLSNLNVGQLFTSFCMKFCS